MENSRQAHPVAEVKFLDETGWKARGTIEVHCEMSTAPESFGSGRSLGNCPKFILASSFAYRQAL